MMDRRGYGVMNVLNMSHLQDPNIFHSLTAEQQEMGALFVLPPSADVSNPVVLTHH
jgi:hypothetical protein